MFLFLAAAHAATITELPPFLRGDVEVGYTFDRLAGTLSERRAEGDVDVALRQVASHNLRYRVTFGVAPGAALFVSVPHTVQKQVTFQDWSAMVYDPATEAGSYQGTATEADITRSSGNGIEGVWIGARGTPFSQALPGRHNRATWLLEGAVRTPSTESNWYSVVEPAKVEGAAGTRGVGEAGVGLRIATAASTTFGKSEPYLALSWEDTLPAKIDVVDDAGETVASGAEIDAGGHFEMRFGTELVAATNEASGSRTAFDLYLNTSYTGASTVPTGIELPNVLATDTPLIQVAESLEAGAGLGINLRFFRNLELDLWGEGRYHLPQRIEHPYAVYTGGDTFHVRTGANVVIRIR